MVYVVSYVDNIDRVKMKPHYVFVLPYMRIDCATEGNTSSM